MSLPSSVPGVLGNTSLDRFDALIVGSGAGGSAAAHVLAAAGRKVLVLEAGINPFPGLDGYDGRGGVPWTRFGNDEVKMSLRDFVWQDPLVEPRTFRQTDGEKARAHPDVNRLTRNVGGAAVISTVAYPRFTAVDFRLASALRDAGRSYPGASFADWPLTYDELEPYYVEAEYLSGVAGADEGPESDPFASPRSRPYPLPKQPPMYVARVIANGAAKLGYTPINLASAVNTRPHDGRPACVGCGFCSNYGCTRNAKGSPAVTTLRRALLSGNCQLRFNCHATRLVLDGTGRRVTAVKYVDNDGQPQSASADTVLLAASAIESARLCQLSDIPDDGGHLGRHVLFHFQTTGVGIYKQRLHGERGRSVTHAMSDFRGVLPGGGELRPDWHLGGILEFGTSSEPIVAARASLRPQAVEAARFAGASFKQLLVESPFSAHISVLVMQGEDAPQATNRVDLDPDVRDVFGLPVPRLTYKNHRFELDASKFYKDKILAVHEKAGARFGFFEPFDPAEPSRSRHVLGGLRMGADPRESVCDAAGKLHGMENLYCADGGVFVTGSGYNPTLTIIALALRTAASLVSPGAPERVLQFAAPRRE